MERSTLLQHGVQKARTRKIMALLTESMFNGKVARYLSYSNAVRDINSVNETHVFSIVSKSR